VKRWLLRGLIVIAPIVGLLSLAELFVRWQYADELVTVLLQPEAGEAYFGARMLESVEEDGVRYAGRPGARVTVFEVEYRHDDLGLRSGPDSPDWKAGKPEGTTRIIVLGDSNAYGWRVAAEQTFAHRLAADLNRVEVALLAYPGYNTADQAALLERLAPILEPDLILVAWYMNDMERLGFHVAADNSLFADPLPMPDAWKPTLWRSLFYQWLSFRTVTRMKETGDYVPGQGENREFAERELLRIRDQARALDVPLAVLDVPWLEPSTGTYLIEAQGHPGAKLSAWLASTCSREEIPHLDLLQAVIGEPAAAFWASIDPKDHHPNADAHRRFADAIAAFLQDRELVR